MTMLPDVDQEGWDQFHTDQFMSSADHQISMLDYDHQTNSAIADLNRLQTLASSDSLTNPIGTRYEPPAPEPPAPPAEPAPAPDATPPEVASAAPATVSPVQTPVPTPTSVQTPTPSPAPPDQGEQHDFFSNAANAAIRAGSNVNQFFDEFQKQTGDQMSNAMNAVLRSGGDVEKFISGLGGGQQQPPAAISGPVVERGGPLQDYARQAAQRAGIDPDVFVHQIQQESGFNPGARSPAGATGIAQFMPATAAGRGLDPTDPYASLDEAARLDAENLKRYGGDYRKALAAYNAGPGNVDKYGDVPPFAETQRYVDTILGGKNLAPVGSDTLTNPLRGKSSADISQFGDPQLTNDEAYSACGPAAAVRFAQRFGRNPTLREAVDLAKTVGWSTANGMAGLGSEKALMDKIGVPTKLISGPDWGTFANEAKTGNPVTISTQGHYFTADGYDPNTNAFHVGRSGLDLKGGSEWMTPEQMQAIMGPVQGGLLADNPQVPTPSVADQDTNTGSWLDRSGDAMATSLNPPTGTGSGGRVTRNVSPIDQNLDMQAASYGEPTALPTQPPQQEQGVWDKLGSGISDVFKSVFGGSTGGPMTSAMQPTPSDTLTNPLGTGNAAAAAPQPSEPDLPVRSLEQAPPPQQTVFDYALNGPQMTPEERQAKLDQAFGPDAAAIASTPIEDIAPKNVGDVLGAAGTPLGGQTWTEGQQQDIARKQFIEEHNPVPENAPPGVRGAVSMAADILTDWKTWATAVPAGKVGELAGELVGSGVKATMANQAAQGAIFAGVNAAAQPGATLQSVTEAMLGGAALGGATGLGTEGVGAAGRWVKSAEGSQWIADRASSLGEFLGSEEGGIGAPPGARAPRNTPADSADPAVQAVDASLGEVPPGTQPGNPWDRFVRAWTNRFEAADRFQQGALRDAGLVGDELQNPDEGFDLSSRLRMMNGDAAGEMHIQDALKPAIRAAGNDVDWLQNVLTHQNNVEVADMIGRRVQAEMADTPVAANIRDDLNSAQTSLRMRQQALDAELNNSVPDATRVAALRRRVAAAQTVLTRRQADFDQARQDILDAAAQGGIDARNNRQFSGDLRAADSERALQSIQADLGPQRWNQVQGAANQVYDYVDRLRQRMLESGLIDQDTYDEWSTTMPHWVPTNILDYVDENAGQALPGSGSRLSLADNGVRQYTVDGTARFRENPLGALYNLAHQVETKARKNEAVNALVNLDELAAPADRVLQRTDRPALAQDNVVSRINNGTVERYVAPADMAAVINGTQIERAPGLVRNWTNFVRNVSTISSPVFALVRNPSMDIPEYLTRELAREGGNPLALPRILAELGRGYADAFQGVLHGEFTGAGTRQFKLGGGGSAGSVERTVADRQRAIDALQQGTGLEIRSPADFARIAHDVATFQPVRAIAERTELGPRIASMRLAEQRGATPLRAVLNGRTVTLDFNEGGNFAKTINQFVPFFNVGLQSSAQLMRMARENPRGFAASMMLLNGAPAVAAEAWNNADPQRAKDYADVPEYLKNQGVVVMLPGEAPVDKDGNRKPQYYWFNTRGGAPFSIMAREATDRILSAAGNENAKVSSAQDLLGQMFSAASPIRASAVGDLPAALSPEIIPGLTTGTQLAMNKDIFRGRDIVSKQADEQAPQAAREIAQGLTAMARVASPKYEIHPSQVAFAVQDMLGGVGSTAMGARELPFMPGAEQKPGNEPQSLPVAGGILKGLGIRGDTGEIGRQARENVLTDSAQRFLQSQGVDYVPSTVSSDINGMPLLRAEQAHYQELTNKYVDDAIHELEAGHELDGEDLPTRQKLVEDAVAGARKQAVGDILDSIPDAEIDRRMEQQRQKELLMGG